MSLYFYLFEAALFHEIMKGSLARSYRQRSFTPCQSLCRHLVAKSTTIPSDALIWAILAGLPFDRTYWHGLVGECLVHGAHDIPRLATAPDTLCCLLAPDQLGKHDLPRSLYAPIQQAHFGTRDLRFGTGFYRPDHVGLNDSADVHRLAAYLESVNPVVWDAQGLAILPECSSDEERAEELAYVRDWWPSLVELYQNARDRDWVVVCERT
jgi:hypothetical protein